MVKYKGPAQTQVYPEWFESQYADPSRTEQVQVSTNFQIDWHTLNIFKKDTLGKLGIQLGTKRMPVYHDDIWVDTVPIEITDTIISCLNHIGKQIINSLRNSDYSRTFSMRRAERDKETEKRMHTTEKSYEKGLV